MSIKLNENDHEIELINKIKNIPSFRYFDQKKIIELREKLSEVLIESFLEDSLMRINKGISQEHTYKIIQKVKSISNSHYETGNKDFHSYLINGIKIYDEKDQITKTYKIIDDINPFNNDFIITNQFRMESNHPQYDNQKPDMVIYCNGIPIIVFELKGLSEENTLELAYNQMKNYQTYLNDLFSYNAFNILSNRSEVKFGSITASLSRYQYWKGPNYENSSMELIDDLLKPDVLIDLIKNFTFYTNSNEKVIASYHQYYGVKKAVKSSKSAMKSNDDGIGKAGIFWHTQGSGKSFSMLFLVKQLSRIKNGTTFLIVTDRNDLDNQLYKTFQNANDFIGQKIHQMKSIDDLSSNLKDRKQDGVFFTTIQKFTKDVGELSQRNDILIISDEAHRSHNNINTKWSIEPGINEIVEKGGSALYLRDAFPNASFIGFTGTPINSKDKSTERIFGKIIDKYLMSDAERDGVVVPIRYESRKPELRFDQEEMNILVGEHTDIIDDINSNSELPAELTKKINKSIQKLENFIADPDRIRGIVIDFINHYESRENVLEGKAMFVALNRFIALDYYNAILELRPEWKNKVKLIISNTNGQNDPPELLEQAGTSEYRKKMAIEFKKNNSEFQIVIVVDMWLTGFDVPSLDAIYIDKPIKMHNLMQAVARTNRVYTNKEKRINKNYGLVIDYIGLWNKLIEALSFYSGKNNNEVISERDIMSLKPEYLKQIESIYQDFELDKLIDFESLVDSDSSFKFQQLDQILNKIYSTKMHQNFVSATKKVYAQFNEVVSLLTTIEKIKFLLLHTARVQIIKASMGEFDLSDKENRLIRQLSKTIKFEGTDIIAEIESNPILLSDILNHLSDSVNPELADLDVRMKMNMTRKLINYSKKINFIQSQNLSKKLNDLMERYDDNYITMEELISTLNEINNEIKKLNNSEINESGYTQSEIAIYNLLAKPVNEVPDFDRIQLAKITRELLDVINDDKKVNKSWIYNDYLISKVRWELKVIMDKYDYPPESIRVTTDEVVNQIMYQKNLRREKYE